MPRVTEGRDPITERDLTLIAPELDWEVQRAMWESLVVARRP